MAKLRRLNGLYWSSCPDSELVARLAGDGASLVVDLTEGECSYTVPPGVERLEYPIPNYSYKPFEDVLVNVLYPVAERLSRGEKVLVHCRGGIGRSGVTVAMLLGLLRGASAEEVRRKLEPLGFQAESPSQKLAFRWFFRARDLVGAEWLRSFVERLRRVGGGGNSYWDLYSHHASTVAGVAVDVLEAVSERLRVSREDMANAYAAGLLHDAGRVLAGDAVHHEVGARLALEIRELAGCCDPNVVSKAVYHHRKRTDLLGDATLRELGAGAQLVAAAVRLADAFTDVYAGWDDYSRTGCYRGAELGGSRLILVLECSPPSWLERRLAEKAEAFTKLTGIEVELEVP
ncbi:MAG: HD domain-containing protein [Infirmifilum sp.]